MSPFAEELVESSGFVKDPGLGFKCSKDNIERLLYYVVNQMASAGFKVSGNKVFYNDQVEYGMSLFGVENVDWESEPKKS